MNILNKLKYGTNIRLLLQRYRIHSITIKSYDDKCEPRFTTHHGHERLHVVAV